MGGFKAGVKKSLGSSRKDLMAVPWSGLLKDGLSFAFRPKRFLPFFIADLSVLMLMAVFAGSAGMDTFLYYAEYGVPAAEIPAFLALFVIATAWAVAGVVITGALIHQSAHATETKKSWSVSLRRAPSLFIAAFLIYLLTFGASAVPYAGFLLQAIVTLLFLFVNQFIVISGLRFDKALVSCIRSLAKKPAGVTFAFIASVIISTLLVIIFASPMAAFLYSSYGEEVPDTFTMDNLSASQEFLFRATVVVLVFGSAVSKVFLIKFLTDVYSAARKKKWVAA